MPSQMANRDTITEKGTYINTEQKLLRVIVTGSRKSTPSRKIPRSTAEQKLVFDFFKQPGPSSVVVFSRIQLSGYWCLAPFLGFTSKQYFPLKI